MCELLNESGEWNFTLLNSWLPRQWMTKLCSCAPLSINHIADHFCFAGTTNDTFSVRALYQELEDNDGVIDDADWIKFWKTVVPER